MMKKGKSKTIRKHRTKQAKIPPPLTTPTEESNENNELLTAEQTAAILNISRSYFYKMNAARRVPKPINLGTNKSYLRWRKRDIIEWIKADCPPRENGMKSGN